MPPFRILFFPLLAFALIGCKPAPDASPGRHEATDAAADITLPFRARIALDLSDGLPSDARLITYVVESNFEAGERRLVAERALPAAGVSGTVVQIDVPKTELSPNHGYEMYATVVDGQGRALMATATNRAPVPGAGLHHEDTFNVRLLPVATPARRARLGLW